MSNVGYLSKPYESTGLWQVLMGSYTICSGMGTDRQRAPGDGMQLYFMCVWAFVFCHLLCCLRASRVCTSLQAFEFGCALRCP